MAESTYQFSCPSCGALLQAVLKQALTSVQCGECFDVFDVQMPNLCVARPALSPPGWHPSPVYLSTGSAWPLEGPPSWIRPLPDLPAGLASPHGRRAARRHGCRPAPLSAKLFCAQDSFSVPRGCYCAGEETRPGGAPIFSTLLGTTISLI